MNVDDKFPAIRELLMKHHKVQLGAVEINENGDFEFLFQRIRPPYELEKVRFLNVLLLETIGDIINHYLISYEKRKANKELIELITML